MYEAVFCIPSNNVYATPTQANACRIMLWCAGHCDLVYLSGEDSDRAIQALNKAVGIQAVEQNDREAVALTKTCPVSHDGSYIDAYLRAHSCFLLPPLQYLDGKRRFRFIAADAQVLKELYNDLVADGVSVEVESKREMTPEPTSGPVFMPQANLPSLTPRQREAMALAVEMGYYELPRQTSTEAIGTQMEVTRRTVETHLRRAEQKLINAISTFAPGYFELPTSATEST